MWIRLPFTRSFTETFTETMHQKGKRQLYCRHQICNFIFLYNTKKILYYCTVEEKIPIKERYSVIHQITCPGCLKRYVGKTDRCFHIRIRKPDQPMHKTSTTLQLFSRIRSTLLFAM